jgi:hypothetical protein
VGLPVLRVNLVKIGGEKGQESNEEKHDESRMIHMESLSFISGFGESSGVKVGFDGCPSLDPKRLWLADPQNAIHKIIVEDNERTYWKQKMD